MLHFLGKFLILVLQKSENAKFPEVALSSKSLKMRFLGESLIWGFSACTNVSPDGFFSGIFLGCAKTHNSLVLFKYTDATYNQRVSGWIIWWSLKQLCQLRCLRWLRPIHEPQCKEPLCLCQLRPHDRLCCWGDRGRFFCFFCLFCLLFEKALSFMAGLRLTLDLCTCLCELRSHISS